MKKNKFSGCLKFFICFLIFITIIILIVNIIIKISFNSWNNQFKEIQLSQQNYVILQVDSKYGKVDTGNRDSIDYGIYWVIETDKTKDEVETFFSNIVDKSNENINGQKNLLFVHDMPDLNYFYFDNLDEYMKQFDSEQYTQNIFIVYILRPGKQLL